MIMHRNQKRATRAESLRIGRMKELGCCACIVYGIPNDRFIECHHIVEGNKRLGHLYTIPLCAGHHRGAWQPAQISALAPELLVSISSGSKVFTPIYGTNRSLWDKVQFVLGLDDEWPVSKILARRVA